MQLHAEVHRRYGNSARFVEYVNTTLATYGITQTDLAAVAGVGRITLNRQLRGHNRMPLATMLAVDEALEDLVAAELV